MTPVADIRTALAEALSAITNIQVSPYVLSQPTPPGVQVMPGRVEYGETMGVGRAAWVFVIQAFVNYTANIGTQILLDQFMDGSGPRSVRAALRANPTLGGIVNQRHRHVGGRLSDP